jgi:hypothetical protein
MTSWRTFLLISWALTWASTIWDLRMSPTRNMRQRWPSRWHMTALRLNSNVCVRFFGRDNLANTIPTMKACIITPTILCRHITKMASGHSSVVCFDPYLQHKSTFQWTHSLTGPRTPSGHTLLPYIRLNQRHRKYVTINNYMDLTDIWPTEV